MKSTITSIVRVAGRYLWVWCFVLFFTLDVIDIWGRSENPPMVARLACSVLPYTTLARYVASDSLINFAVEQCTTSPSEPAFSIAFSLVKLNTATFLLPLFLLNIVFRKDVYIEFMTGRLNRFSLKGGYSRELHRCTVVCLILLGIVALMINLLWSYKTPANFDIGLFGKIAGEDLFVMVVQTTVSYIYLTLRTFIPFYTDPVKIRCRTSMTPKEAMPGPWQR
jgi:hypothetical protein